MISDGLDLYYFDSLALLLGGGFAVISVGDILKKCSLIMNFNFSTGLGVEEIVSIGLV